MIKKKDYSHRGRSENGQAFLTCKKSMPDKESISKIAQLLLEAGAVVKEDPISVSLTISGCGLLFTKGLFSISLCTNNNLLQYNVFRPGMDFIKVRSTHSWVEADIEKGIFPVAFWDGVYLMVQGLRKKLFPKECAELASACDLLFDAINRHRKNPSMSTLVMLRALRDYIQKKAPHYLEVRRKKNRENQHIYEKMLKLVQGAPHSLNTLRALNLPMEIKKVGNSYWEVSVLDGDFMGRGNNLVSTAAIVLRQYRKFQRTAV